MRRQRRGGSAGFAVRSSRKWRELTERVAKINKKTTQRIVELRNVEKNYN